MNSIFPEKSKLRPGFWESQQKGFSLLELMVAIVIFLIVSGAIWGLLNVARIDRNRASRRTDVEKNARIAIQMIGRDALNAGYGFNRSGAVAPDNFLAGILGTPPDVNLTRDMLTSIVAGNGINPNNLSADTTLRTDVVSFVYRDTDFNGGAAVNLQSAAASTSSPAVVRLTSKGATELAQAQPYDLFLVESSTSQVVVMATAVNGSNTIDAAAGDPLGVNQALNGTGSNGSVLRQCTSGSDSNCTTYLASMKRFFFVSYKVSPDGTLLRRVYGNNRGALASQQIQELPLAYNVEDFQIRYVLDDGTVTNDPSAGPDGVSGTVDDDYTAYNRIRQLTVTVKVQSSERDEKTGGPMSITISATFSTRNMEYDQG
jgi:prepilin-type N-terminal cleavage/methylation domain-containing protein